MTSTESKIISEKKENAHLKIGPRFLVEKSFTDGEGVGNQYVSRRYAQILKL